MVLALICLGNNRQDGPPPTGIYSLSLHDALPISDSPSRRRTDRGAASASTPPCRRRADRKSTRLNSSHVEISYAVFCLKKKILIKLLPILGTISGKTVKLMVLALICLGNNRQD